MLRAGQPVMLEGGVTLTFTEVVIEAIADGGPGYPAGSGVTLTLVLIGLPGPSRQHVSLLSTGYTSRPQAWFDHYRVTLLAVHDPHHDPVVEVVVERRGTSRTAAPARQVRIARGGELALDDGVSMIFLGHSHKRTHVGQTSPLGVSVEYRAPGQEPEPQSVSVFGEHRAWAWRDYELAITSYEYGAWMELSIARLTLVPVTLP
jgi:hypothetical protein